MANKKSEGEWRYKLTSVYGVISDGTRPMQAAGTKKGTALEAVIHLDAMNRRTGVQIKVQREVRKGTWKDDTSFSFKGVQKHSVVPLRIPFYNGYGIRVVAMQSAGRPISIAYEFIVRLGASKRT